MQRQISGKESDILKEKGNVMAEEQKRHIRMCTGGWDRRNILMGSTTVMATKVGVELVCPEQSDIWKSTKRMMIDGRDCM